MWSARQSREMGRRVAGLLGGLLVGLLLVAAPAAAAFVDPINLSNSASISERPAIAVNKAGRVFVAWKEASPPNFSIRFRRSKPTLGTCGGGLEFDEEEPVTELWAGTVAPSGPALAATDDDEVFVAWQASSGVLFRRSTDAGKTFAPAGPPLGLSNGSSNVPSVAAEKAVRGVFVAWSNGSAIHFVKSTDLGATFGSPAILASPMFTRKLQKPSVAAGLGKVFVAWEEQEQVGLFARVVSIGYKTFTWTADPGTASTVPLSTGVPSSVLGPNGPNLAFGDDTLAAAFADPSAVYHRSSGPDGTSFSPALTDAPDPLTSGLVFPLDARVARRNGSTLVAWAQSAAGNTGIRVRLLGNGAMGPGPVTSTEGARSPAAAIDSTGRLLVAWQGREPSDPLKPVQDEIYLSYSGGTGGDEPNAWVEMTPQTLNAKTITQGQGVFTLRIRFMDGSAVDYPTSLAVNGNPAVTPLRSSLVDTDGNGSLDTLEVKIKRQDLQFEETALTAAQGDGNYPVKVKGNMKDGRCFSGDGEVRIIH